MKKSKYTKDVLEKIIVNSRSMSDVLRNLGLKTVGGNFAYIGRRIKEYELDVSHWTGQAWNRGLTRETSSSIDNIAIKNSYTDEQVFCINSPISGKSLTSRLKKMGILYECQICGIFKWRNKPIILDLDHINGNRSDNRLENLRFLCPNCHRQTPTWGRSKVNGPVEELVYSSG